MKVSIKILIPILALACLVIFSKANANDNPKCKNCASVTEGDDRVPTLTGSPEQRGIGPAQPDAVTSASDNPKCKNCPSVIPWEQPGVDPVVRDSAQVYFEKLLSAWGVDKETASPQQIQLAIDQSCAGYPGVCN